MLTLITFGGIVIVSVLGIALLAWTGRLGELASYRWAPHDHQSPRPDAPQGTCRPSSRAADEVVLVCHGEMVQIVNDAEPLLRRTWDRRRANTDILVLCNLDREEVNEACIRLWGRAEVGKIKREAAASGKRPMCAFFQPYRWLNHFGSDGSPAHAATARELRGFSAPKLGHVPLLVLFPDGIWATRWTVPGSGMAVVRGNPDLLD